MQRKISRFLSWACLLSYALILAFAGIAVWRAQEVQRESAQLEFDELAAFVAAAWPQAGSRGERFDEAAFSEALRDSVRFSAALVSVRLSGPGGLEYTASKETRAGRPAALSPLSYKPGAFFTPRKAALTTAIAGAGLTLDAQPSWIDPALLRLILFKTLAALLAPLSIATGLFVLEVGVYRGEGRGERREGAGNRESGVGNGEQVGSGKWEVVSGQKRDAEAERTTEIYPESPQDFRAETLPTSSSYSQLPTTNFQYETNSPPSEQPFLAALTSALEEAALLDGELSLAAIVCADESRKAGAAGLASKTFGERAVFDITGRAVFVILTWVGLEEAQGIAEKFAETLANNAAGRAALGISAKQGRTVAAARLAGEALEAAKKAASGGGAAGGGGAPVVSFRVDPQKWAEFAGSFGGRS